MRNLWNARWTEYFLLALIFCSAAFLFLSNLGNQYLWQDEAQTAVISRTVLAYGVPVGYDGRNFFSQELGAEYGKNYIWKWHTWLPFYVLAIFYKLLGTGTYVSRLPFALFGVASVLLTYFFCKTFWKNKNTAAVAAILLLLSVPFLLLSRQCRYYSMTAFFSLLSLYAYVKILDGRKHAYFLFVFSSVLLFHTNYVYFAPLLAAVVLHSLFFNRHMLRTVLLLNGIVIIINIPWIIWFATMKYGQRYGADMFEIKKLLRFSGMYFALIGRYLFPPYLLLVVLLAVIGSKIRTGVFVSRSPCFWQRLSLPLFFVVFNLIVLIFTSTWPFFRYLAPLVPVFAILVALPVVAAARLHPIVTIAALTVLILAGHLKEFFYEITHDYNGPIEGIVKYLNENGSKDDVVAITYGDMPLKFYTQMRIVGGLTGEDLAPAKQAKWVIMRKYIIDKKDAAVREYFIQNIPWENYERIVIDYPDIPFENRENLEEHHFRTVVDEDRVTIFRRIR